jgi:HSP20 family protein
MAAETKHKQEVPVKKGQELQKATPVRTQSPFDEMDRMMESIFPRGWLRPFNWDRPLWSELVPFEHRLPHVDVDVIDRDDEVVVRAQVPGVDKKDIDVSVTDSTVTIKGKTASETKEEKGDYYRCEISRGAFSRTISLPGNVDGAKARAVMKDGVLELTMPKIEKARRHAIKIQ